MLALALLGCLGFALLLQALLLVDVHLLVVLTSTTPLFAIVLSRLFLGEAFSAPKLVCAILCFGGVVLVLLPQLMHPKITAVDNGGAIPLGGEGGDFFPISDPDSDSDPAPLSPTADLSLISPYTFLAGVLCGLTIAFVRSFSGIILKKG